tara:strand:- start:1291 stop:1593 length:303 start_codon:yes stop_codon:yes gene_type:complete
VEEQKLRQYIRNFILELKDEDEDLEEVTVTANVDGYSTPHAFSTDEDEELKKKKLTKSTGYPLVVKEAIDEKDIKLIKQIIRDVIGDVYRDIWLKRNTWK